MESIKKESGVLDPPTWRAADFDPRGHSASIAVFGEGSGTAFVQIPNHSHSNQALISVSLASIRGQSTCSRMLITSRVPSRKDAQLLIHATV